MSFYSKFNKPLLVITRTLAITEISGGNKLRWEIKPSLLSGEGGKRYGTEDNEDELIWIGGPDDSCWVLGDLSHRGM